jgi:hypothetical protein
MKFPDSELNEAFDLSTIDDFLCRDCGLVENGDRRADPHVNAIKGGAGCPFCTGAQRNVNRR